MFYQFLFQIFREIFDKLYVRDRCVFLSPLCCKISNIQSMIRRNTNSTFLLFIFCIFPFLSSEQQIDTPEYMHFILTWHCIIIYSSIHLTPACYSWLLSSVQINKSPLCGTWGRSIKSQINPTLNVRLPMPSPVFVAFARLARRCIHDPQLPTIAI